MIRTASVISLIVLCGCGDELKFAQAPLSPAAVRAGAHTTYVVDTLPSLGGTSRGSSINNRGWVAGFSATAQSARHAVLWQKGTPIDLGTLGTNPSLRSAVWFLGQNNTGMVVGFAQTDENEERGEQWSCAPFLGNAGKICLGFAWENGEMHPLPTLGGPNGYAASVNNRGQVVGWAETLVEDPTCNETQVYQFRAVLWEPKKGTKLELPPFPGDSTSAATAINQRGQVVGISGDCDIAVGNFSARHAVLWDKNGLTEIPHLGGEIWHTPAAINDSGHVVGFSNPTGVNGRTFLPRAFLWTGGATSTDLGVLSGDDNSQAMAINNRGQVVGVSCLGSACRGFIYVDGVMRDLKEVVAPDFPGTFLSARSITDDGRITGNVRLLSGATRAFLASPVRGSKTALR